VDNLDVLGIAFA